MPGIGDRECGWTLLILSVDLDFDIYFILCQTVIPFSNFQNRRKLSFVWGNGTERSHPNRPQVCYNPHQPFLSNF